VRNGHAEVSGLSRDDDEFEDGLPMRTGERLRLWVGGD
jgi:hypothetical protein